MATKKEYLNFILDQLSGLSEISYRMMMGEYKAGIRLLYELHLPSR